MITLHRQPHSFIHPQRHQKNTPTPLPTALRRPVFSYKKILLVYHQPARYGDSQLVSNSHTDMTHPMYADLPSAQRQRTLIASDYAEQVLQQHFNQVLTDFNVDQFEQPLSFEDFQAAVKQALSHAFLEVEWMKVMRRLRARLMFRWIWQDANQLTHVVQLTRELSDFADVAIQAAVNFARRALVEKHGEPIGENGQVQDLIVIGMGKLGAQELNLSSDIDLIFAWQLQ